MTTATTDTGASLVDHVWKRFQDVGFTPDFGPDNSKLLIQLYRRLAADPRPITRSELEAMADELGVARDEAIEFVQYASEPGDDGEIRGIVGLSLNEYPHKFRVGGNELHNWCALDPLLIVPALTEPVEIESVDPETGEAVSVSATPAGVKGYSPTDAVLSIVVPEPGATDSVEAVWMMFCHHVHFFTSRESGERFFADKVMEVYFLSVVVAFELGRLTFGPVFEQL